MNRKRQQAELMFALGQFFGPVLRVAERPEDYDMDEKTRILARFFHDGEAFNELLIKFCLTGEPGHKYATQFAQAQQQISKIHSQAAYNNAGESELLHLVTVVSAKVTEILVSIPVPVDSAIYEARTPFSTYCFVKDLCSTVRDSVIWLDRYFDQTVFHRFFADTPRSALITLVTLPVMAPKGPADAKRISEFLDVSRLFALERGQAGYRLIANSQFHDRWLRCDDQLFVLGGSIKDLAKPFSIARIDSTADNRKYFDEAVANGTELFGPNQPQHA